ncbi:MAG: SIS domain-containing protein [bacterium]|nr:SIS domain-containing protein [Gammaproteobacteria bacterium]HIL95796.1 SIS domain-containing protein [Pseudomonadales bacterium]
MNIKEKMSSIIKMEADAIANINVTDEFEKAVEMVRQCTGKVITTGIGKAGFVAQRFAATLCSTGIPAFFIHPAEAGHGDLGMLAEDDLIIAFSTSGKSIEVVEMLEMSTQFGIRSVIGITSHTDSPLRDLSSITLDMGPDIEEPCPLNLTPSATIAVMSAICDAIALTLVELTGFTKEEYGRRHHKGYLGTIARKKHEYDSQEES